MNKTNRKKLSCIFIWLCYFLNGKKLQNKELKFLVLIFDFIVLENLRF